MMMYSAETRGFYSTEIHTDIPADAIEISDRAYGELLDAQNSGKAIEPDAQGRPVAVARPSVPPVVVAGNSVLKSDVWRRCTDDEADLLDAALDQAPTRLRRLWDDSTIILLDAAEFPSLMAATTAVVGAERAAVLLAPSQ